MKDRRWFALPVLLLVAALSSVVTRGLAQDGAPKGAGAPPGAPNLGGELVEALKKSPGCLGVESAFTQSRKAAIFAWFENKKAVLAWYASDFHQTAMMGMKQAAHESDAKKGDSNKGESEEREPLAFIADDSGPILCIATITPIAPGAKPLVEGFPMPIQQISIELYQPLPGGLAFNGRFAPPGVKVPHLVEYAPDEHKPAAGGDAKESATRKQ